MPVLASAENFRAGLRGVRPAPGLFPECANPFCRSGWLRLWRSRRTPVFEGGWSCGDRCTDALVESAVEREMKGYGSSQPRHHHRLPLGLILLSEGWITADQLKAALQAQKKAGSGRLGSWLMRDAGVKEWMVTRALSIQWSCPVLSVDAFAVEPLPVLAPRLLAEAFGILPVRVAAGRILYVGFEDHIDPCVTFALERMTGLRVEAGLVDGSVFRRQHERLLESPFPKARLIEAPGPGALAGVLSRMVEEARPEEARLVRMHDCFWLRMWHGAGASRMAQPRRGEVEDVLATIGSWN